MAMFTKATRKKSKLRLALCGTSGSGKTYSACLIFIRSALRGRKFDSIGLCFRWFEKNRQRDKDNIAFAKKFILDALQTAKILVNDGWSQIRYFHDEFEVDKDNPRVEITIEGMK